MFSNRKIFQGLKVQPALNQTVDAFTNFFTGVTFSMMCGAINQITEQAENWVALKNTPNWQLHLDKGLFYALYLPSEGISGLEPVVFNYLNRARENKLVVGFRPLLWSEAPKKRRSTTLSLDDQVLYQALTYIR